MPLVLTEEQTMLRDSARDFVQQKSPVSSLRKLRDENDQTGFDRALWKEMAELGWAGIIVPEEYGGSDFGYTGLGIVLEETGRTLTASPLVSTSLLGATALLLAGNSEQKQSLLPKVCSGDVVLAAALEERAHHNPFSVETTAEKTASGYKLSGRKTFVLDGHVADELIVVARTSGATEGKAGLSLFLVNGETNGLVRERTIMVDSRNAANVTFDGVEVPAGNLLGPLDQGGEILEILLDRARIGIAAEMLGTAQAAFDVTHEYLQTRTQFGQLIGSFQALQHRAAKMFSELEISKSCVLQALQAIDTNANDVPTLASLAKAQLGKTLHLISSEALQMHGGVGMTDEYDVGLYLKRARVVEQAFGNERFHIDRYAELDGF